jgi:hypothetical protein
MAIMNWRLSDPLFFSGVYRSHIKIDFFKLRTSLKQIPHRGYRLARNDNYELVAE